MSDHDACPAFALSVSARHDGTLEAAYIKMSNAEVASTKELSKSALLADFDVDGNLVGIEILAPVTISEVLNLADVLQSGQNQAFCKFVWQSAPPALVTA